VRVGPWQNKISCSTRDIFCKSTCDAHEDSAGPVKSHVSDAGIAVSVVISVLAALCAVLLLTYCVLVVRRAPPALFRRAPQREAGL
jgi:hypothetical protein